VVVDSTFATPLGQKPLDLGADVVVHSATKYLAGHSDVLLGAVVARDPDLIGRITGNRVLGGGIPGPMEAWIALRGLRTFPLRWERACANAAEIARRCAAHPVVERVRHLSLPEDPGHALADRQMTAYGAIVSLELRGGAPSAEAVADATSLWVHATSLGGVESTLERRRRWPEESPEVPDGLLRLSVGIEDVEDLWADLCAALDAVSDA
jgi:cystathionine gamma-synthase